MREEPESRFTLSILTGNETGALLRLAMTLSRHRIAIESLNSTSDEALDLCRHVVRVRAPGARVRRAVKQIGVSVGVLAADCYPEGETVDREIALYKLSAGGGGDSLRDLVRACRARVLVRGEGYVIIEKTGCGRDIEDLYESLRPFGVMEFVRSGCVVVTKSGPAEPAGMRISPAVG